MSRFAINKDHWGLMICFMPSWRSHICDILALSSSALSRSILRLLHSRLDRAACWEPRRLTQVFHSAQDVKHRSLFSDVYHFPCKKKFSCYTTHILMLTYAQPLPRTCPLPAACRWSLVFLPDCRTLLLASFSPEREFQHHDVVICLPQLNHQPPWNASLPSPSFPCYFVLFMSQDPWEGRKKNKTKWVVVVRVCDTGPSGNFFLTSSSFLHYCFQMWTQGVHLVSSAISGFIECVGDESCTAGSWSWKLFVYPLIKLKYFSAR